MKNPSEQAQFGETPLVPKGKREVEPDEERGHGRRRNPAAGRRGGPQPDPSQPHTAPPEIKEEQNQDNDR